MNDLICGIYKIILIEQFEVREVVRCYKDKTEMSGFDYIWPPKRTTSRSFIKELVAKHNIKDIDQVIEFLHKYKIGE